MWPTLGLIAQIVPLIVCRGVFSPPVQPGSLALVLSHPAGGGVNLSGVKARNMLHHLRVEAA
ncbi:hypothetical protein SCH4B_2003 [Ruegeria sp. TrichCH4B]|nr:hypothetical protein SCH4B_2003 [Ruegeria sp. TrichCH4B]